MDFGLSNWAMGIGLKAGQQLATEVKDALKPPPRASITDKVHLTHEAPRRSGSILPPSLSVPPSALHIAQHKVEYHDGWTTQRVIKYILEGLGKTVVFVVNDYVDFFRELASYDGSWSHLFGNIHFLYRAIVTALITIGLIQIAPLLEIISQMGGLILSALTKAVRWAMIPIEWAMEAIEWTMWDLVKYARQMIGTK